MCCSLPSCEKSASAEDYPIMESFYKESVTLPLVTLDSVIMSNIKAASLRLSISIESTWAGDTVIHF